MSYEQILTEVRDRVGIITMNQPQKLNPMSSTMTREMGEQMSAWNEDPQIGAIVITGAGRGYSSGADIGSFEQTVSAGRGNGAPPRIGEDWLSLVRRSKPIVCAINGVAVGMGITTTLPCDVRVAAEGARMSFRFVRIGLTPEYASTHYLVYLVGLGQTMELMLTGKFIEAQEAQEHRPGEPRVPGGDDAGRGRGAGAGDRLQPRVAAFADQAADPRPLHGARRRRGAAHRVRDISRVAVHPDPHKEALIAFRERREPRYH